MSDALDGWTVAVPEARQLDVLASLLSRRGAGIHRCPLIGIVDAPDEAPVVAWLQALLRTPPDYLVLLTGEGVTRLRGFAQSAGIGDDELSDALRRTAIVSRGPKPARALKALSVQPTHFASAPTTDGVIDTLRELPLTGRRVGVQLYGDDPNVKLIRFLEASGSHVSSVAPYRYARELSDEATVALIDRLAGGDIDAIVFTSMAQVRRLLSVADVADRAPALRDGLASTVVAAVGPVVADTLHEADIGVDVMPAARFFMKPLVTALVEHRRQQAAATAPCSSKNPPSAPSRDN
ncbi:MAG: uroporphyrinogen-III synthase [Pseudomonadota bacterium]